MMKKANYEKPTSIIIYLTGKTVLLTQSESSITDDPATEPASVREWQSFENDGEKTSGKGSTLWSSEW